MRSLRYLVQPAFLTREDIHTHILDQMINDCAKGRDASRDGKDGNPLDFKIPAPKSISKSGIRMHECRTCGLVLGRGDHNAALNILGLDLKQGITETEPVLIPHKWISKFSRRSKSWHHDMPTVRPSLVKE